MPKKYLRKKLLDKREKLGSGDKMKADWSIFEALKTTPQIEAASKVVAFFPHKSEPNIEPFLEWVVSNRKELYLPRVNESGLDLVQVLFFSDLKEGAYGIMEPKSDLQATDLTEFDVILVPGVGFTPNGDRLGFGGGFYDRLLKLVKGCKIGIGYEFQVLDEIPVEEHDVSLDMIVTDSGSYIV
jgi:5-formyltetrahydrofolate cyclo-ligase